ncbi:MAG: DUF1365 domain-containing protein [Armatimonadetes bacterium]|nr:DUF1365 domain-containing protein [Akkermansiaceae bacterium]
MNSAAPCLYECKVSHTRLSPKKHAFDYRVFMFAVDIDELPEIANRIHFLSHNRFNLFSIDNRDHISTDPAKSIRANLTDWLLAKGISVPTDARIILLTFPRVLGYSFNPVSFYYISSSSGVPFTAVAEVTNTFREMKLFPVDALGSDGKWKRLISKDFYVSPFSDPKDSFNFRLGQPDREWQVNIDNITDGIPTLLSAIHGHRRELTSSRLFLYAFKYPLLSLAIILSIHWQALLLYLRKVPYFAKSTPLEITGLPAGTAHPDFINTENQPTP